MNVKKMLVKVYILNLATSVTLFISSYGSRLAEIAGFLAVLAANTLLFIYGLAALRGGGRQARPPSVGRARGGERGTGSGQSDGKGIGKGT